MMTLFVEIYWIVIVCSNHSDGYTQTNFTIVCEIHIYYIKIVIGNGAKYNLTVIHVICFGGMFQTMSQRYYLV